MKTRAITGLTSVVMMLLVAALTTPAAVADDGSNGQSQNTEDVLHMVDGRVFHGAILEETDTNVKFEFVDDDTGIRGVRTFSKSNIAEIERDVPIKRENDQQDNANKPKRSGSGSSGQPDDSDSTELRRFGVRRGAADDDRVPSFYIVPMKGQMGTDIRFSIYEKVAEDIRRVDPDVIIFKMNSQDVPKSDLDRYMLRGIDQEELSRPDFGDYRKILDLFKDELGHYKQAIWVQDAWGLSACLALGWEDLYMAPEARLGGLRLVTLLPGAESWSDRDVRAKMMAAWSGIAKGLIEYGGYSHTLADAMIFPEKVLSASFQGREVVWSFDQEGEFLVDTNPEATVTFTAKEAEDLVISDGTAESIEDLALLMGYREFRLADGTGKKIVNDYIDKWREYFDRSLTLMQDYNQYMGWAQGDEALRWLGKAKQTLEKIVRMMKLYPAVETRLGLYGITIFNLETQIEILKERIRQLNNQDRGGGGGYGNGGGGMGGS